MKHIVSSARLDKLKKKDSIDDVLDASFGAWKRRVNPEKIRNEIKEVFNRSVTRHHLK